MYNIYSSNKYIIYYNVYFFFRMNPPDIDSKLCNAFEEKINFQLFSFTGDSDSEEDNYYEWEAVSLK